MQKLTFFFLLLVFCPVWAQKQNSVWYFGNYCGIKFLDSGPVALTEGELANNYQIGAPSEGCSGIADPNGNLLFYTNGISVLNRNHTRMPHGDGLYGHWSATQAALVIPRPGTADRYYVFTTDENTDISPPNEGLRYSEVDMQLDGGLGDVIEGTKNTLLLKPATEKLTGVRHSNNTDYWIIAHGVNTNEFYTFLVTASGVSKTPVISKAGSIHAANLGYLKASGDGSKLAVALYGQATFEVLDFNPCTGIISNPLTLQSPLFEKAYGVEFSPDQTKLYGSTGTANSLLIQLDLTAGSAEHIVNSAVILSESPDYYTYGAILLGPDQKIYLTRWGWEHLAVIEKPNLKGKACGFIREGFLLNPASAYRIGRNASSGLPNFVSTSPPAVRLDLGPDFSMCRGETRMLSAGSIPGASYRWQNNSASSSLLVTTPGTYWVEVQNGPCIFRDTVIIGDASVQVFSGRDTTVCGDIPLLLEVSLPDEQVIWNDGTKGNRMLITESGTWWTDIWQGNCRQRDSIRVQFVDCISFIPNILTPNGDEVNDRFVIPEMKHESWQLTISNRWGNVIYQTEQYKNDWPANPVKAGVYFYHLKSQCRNTSYKGWIHVVN